MLGETVALRPAPTGEGATCRLRKRLAATLWLAVFAVVAAGCTEVRLVEGYDPQIEEGLTDYYESTMAFLSNAADEAGEPAGSYDASRPFYNRERARLDTLILKAQADDPDGRCPTVDLAARAATLFADLGDLGDDDLISQSRERLAEIEGNCTVKQVSLIRANQALVEAIHKRNDRLQPAVAGIVRDTVEQSVRIALTAERAKRR